MNSTGRLKHDEMIGTCSTHRRENRGVATIYLEAWNVFERLCLGSIFRELRCVEVQGLSISDGYRAYLSLTGTGCIYLWRVQGVSISDGYRAYLSLTGTGLIYLWRVQGLSISDGYRAYLSLMGTGRIYLWRVQMWRSCKYRVIQNDCRGYNNLSYTIHLR